MQKNGNQFACSRAIVTRLLIQHNQEIPQMSPDPLPLLREGSRYIIGDYYIAIDLQSSTAAVAEAQGRKEAKSKWKKYI